MDECKKSRRMFGVYPDILYEPAASPARQNDHCIDAETGETIAETIRAKS
jgi:hypothetical protein